ncbi:hypothetical protein QWA68_015527 [Fusarium oxysporum]|nr:hypothetical protein QWA68_015527 [Fusarium oxysporum]
MERKIACLKASFNKQYLTKVGCRCRTRKKKCDRTYPAWTACRQAGEPCHQLRRRNAKVTQFDQDPLAIKSEIRALHKRVAEMEARSTTNTLQHETSEIARIAHPSIFPDSSGLDASPTSMHAEAAISLSAPFDSLPNVQIGNDTLLWGDPFWLNMDSLCHFAPDLEAEDIPGSGVAGLDQLGTHGQSNT